MLSYTLSGLGASASMYLGPCPIPAGSSPGSMCMEDDPAAPPPPSGVNRLLFASVAKIPLNQQVTPSVNPPMPGSGPGAFVPTAVPVVVQQAGSIIGLSSTGQKYAMYAVGGLAALWLLRKLV